MKSGDVIHHPNGVIAYRIESVLVDNHHNSDSQPDASTTAFLDVKASADPTPSLSYPKDIIYERGHRIFYNSNSVIYKARLIDSRITRRLHKRPEPEVDASIVVRLPKTLPGNVIIKVVSATVHGQHRSVFDFPGCRNFTENDLAARAQREVECIRRFYDPAFPSVTFTKSRDDALKQLLSSKGFYNYESWMMKKFEEDAYTLEGKVLSVIDAFAVNNAGVFVKDFEWNIVMPAMDGVVQSLFPKMLDSGDTVTEKESFRAQAIAQLPDLVRAFNKAGFIHNDITHVNVFYKKATDTTIKLFLGGFGLAQKQSNFAFTDQTLCAKKFDGMMKSRDVADFQERDGTPGYISFDYANCATRLAGPAQDVYSAAVCLVELKTTTLLSRRFPDLTILFKKTQQQQNEIMANVADYVGRKLPAYKTFFDTTKPIYERCLDWEKMFPDRTVLFCHKMKPVHTISSEDLQDQQ